MVTNIIPRQEDITGASFSGAEGPGRTYTLANANVHATSPVSVLVQGAPLMFGQDFTVTGQVLTIGTFLYNDQFVSIQYYTTDPAYVITAPTGGTKQDMIRRKLALKVFGPLGKTVTLKSVTSPVYNSRGEVESQTETSSSIVIVPYDQSDTRTIEKLGELQVGEVEAAVPYDITININDKINVEGSDWLVIATLPNWLPDNVVTIVRLRKIMA